jgi:transmembrane sensor
MSDRDKITQLVDLSAIEAEAADWVARLDADGGSAQTLRDFERWKAQSPLHRDAADKLAGLWADMDVLAMLAPTAKLPVHRSWRRRLRRGWQVARPAGLGAMAAVAAMLLVFLGVNPSLRQAMIEGVVGAETEVYATQVGEQRSITLDDGSTVQLNTDSLLEVRYTTVARDLRLVRGEAFFEVAANPARPFSVYGKDGVARAIGTAFVVRVQAERMDVTVTKGVVEVAALEPAPARTTLETMTSLPRIAPALVSAESGQVTTAVIAPQGISRDRLNASDAARQFAWRQGMLAFSGDRLDSVVADVSRYTDIDIEIADPALTDLRVSGYFKVGEVEPMLEALESGFNVKVERVDARHVRLHSRG